jgi:hypothetical protein
MGSHEGWRCPTCWRCPLFSFLWIDGRSSRNLVGSITARKSSRQDGKGSDFRFTRCRPERAYGLFSIIAGSSIAFTEQDWRDAEAYTSFHGCLSLGRIGILVLTALVLAEVTKLRELDYNSCSVLRCDGGILAFRGKADVIYWGYCRPHTYVRVVGCILVLAVLRRCEMDEMRSDNPIVLIEKPALHRPDPASLDSLEPGERYRI